MTEPISYEKQLKVILWANPDLAGKDCGLCNGDGAMPRRASWYESIPGMLSRHNSTKELEPLYVWDKNRNWRPNYQLWMTEYVPKLEAEKHLIGFTNCSVNDILRHKWVLSPEYKDPFSDADPYAALAQLLEAR